MRSLIMLRHAKSDWRAAVGDDAERPLSKRGRRAARTMGRFLARTGELPDRALTSPALRAASTLRLAMQAGGWSCPVEACPELYSGPEEALELIRREPDGTEVLLAVGHEPTWSSLAGALVGGARLRLPTAAMARIDFSGERWAAVEPGAGELAWLVVPSLLTRG